MRAHHSVCRRHRTLHSSEKRNGNCSIRESCLGRRGLADQTLSVRQEGRMLRRIRKGFASEARWLYNARNRVSSA